MTGVFAGKLTFMRTYDIVCVCGNIRHAETYAHISATRKTAITFFENLGWKKVRGKWYHKECAPSAPR